MEKPTIENMYCQIVFIFADIGTEKEIDMNQNDIIM